MIHLIKLFLMDYVLTHISKLMNVLLYVHVHIGGIGFSQELL